MFAVRNASHIVAACNKLASLADPNLNILVLTKVVQATAGISMDSINTTANWVKSSKCLQAIFARALCNKVALTI